jgi:hypothetical protein
MNVRNLDVRPGGGFEYAMTATARTPVEARKAAALPQTTLSRGTYTDAPHHRLAYRTSADFIRSVAPYEAATTVEFHAGPTGLRMVVNKDVMHNGESTQWAALGLNEQFNRLGRIRAPSKPR